MSVPIRRTIALFAAMLLAAWPLGTAPVRAAEPVQSVYWRVVGHASEGDREFHFVVTFARLSVAKRDGAPRDVYVAGFEITGDDPHTFVDEQRLDRPGIGDSALNDPADLHVDTWRLRGEPARNALRLVVAGDRGAIALALRGNPNPISVLPGHARSAALATDGTLVVDGRRHTVHGSATVERIAGGDIDTPQADWSWYDVQLDDGRAIFVDERRNASGDIASAGAAQQRPDGRASVLVPSDVSASAWGRCAWTSPSTGASYPTVWDVTLAGQHLVLQATVREQEIVPSIGGPAFWEGAADVIDAVTDARIGWAIVTMRGIPTHPVPCGG